VSDKLIAARNKHRSSGGQKRGIVNLPILLAVTNLLCRLGGSVRCSEKGAKTGNPDWTIANFIRLKPIAAHNDLHFAIRLHKLQIIMKNQFSILRLVAFAAALFSFAPLATAHERDTFKVGDKYYLLTVGSLKRTFIVDNISGVDLRVSQLSGPAAMALAAHGKARLLPDSSER